MRQTWVGTLGRVLGGVPVLFALAAIGCSTNSDEGGMDSGASSTQGALDAGDMRPGRPANDADASVAGDEAMVDAPKPDTYQEQDGATQSDDGSPDADAGGAQSDANSQGPGRFDPDFRTSDAFFTLADDLKPALPGSPHGHVRIYYSSNLRLVADEEEFSAPVGSVAIKDQDVDNDGTVDVVMVMIKGAPGSDEDTRDWVYQRRSPSGKLQDEGAPTLDFCADCHNGFAATDGLRGFGLRD